MIDCHTHTHNSPDAQNTVSELCEKAISMNLNYLAVTDHCEVNRFYGIEHYNAIPNQYDTYHFDLDFEKSMIENLECKDIYNSQDNFKLLSGVELGQPDCDFELAEKIISDERLDFVIASLHQLSGHDDFAFIDYKNADIPSLLDENYKHILSICRWNKFDILGHLTYTLRYIEGQHGIHVDMNPYEDIIRESFKVLAQNGKGIEINTSGLRQAYGKTFPTFNYIKMFKDAGGEVLSLGSDSHRTEDLAKGIPDALELAVQAGFKYVCVFIKREPHFIKI